VEQFLMSVAAGIPTGVGVAGILWWRIGELKKTLDVHTQDKTIHVNGTWKELVRKLLLGGTK